MPQYRQINTLPALTLTLALIGCDRQATPETTPSAHHEIDIPIEPHAIHDSTKPEPEPPLPPMLALAEKSGCLNCHAVDHKVIGPAWQDVSKRYAGDPGARDRLIRKVKAGGGGNWTEITGGVVMPAYGGRVPERDIEKLVNFVLSLAAQPP